MVLSPIATEHVNSPRNAGVLENATHIGEGGTPGDGPYVRLYLLVEEDTIKKATYQCNGCPSSTAAASVLAQLITGRLLEKALLLTAQELLLILGGLPDGKEYYAKLAVDALLGAKRI